MDAFNWAKKIEIVSEKAGLAFDEYKGGREEFMEEFTRFFSDPRRFSYTPLICVRGCKPGQSKKQVEVKTKAKVEVEQEKNFQS